MERSETTEGIIRASEIGEYAHCHRAWWLGRVQGVENRNRGRMEAGTAQHQAHGRRVALASLLRAAAAVCVIVAVVAGVALVLRILGLV